MRLTTPTARISYELLHRSGIDNATHDLCVDRLNAKGETVTLFHADCSAPGWKTFGLDVTYFSFEKPPAEDMMLIADARVIVDALVYWIDVASRREAVHDPDTEQKLRKKAEEFKALQKTRGLRIRFHEQRRLGVDGHGAEEKQKYQEEVESCRRRQENGANGDERFQRVSPGSGVAKE